MTDVQVLNYTTHAIEELTKNIPKIERFMPHSANVYKRIIGLLRQAEKFILPNCCDLFDPDELKQSHMDLFHLPYPICVFEAPWIKEEVPSIASVGGLPTAISTKRIALCWEAKPGLEIIPGLFNILDRFEQGGAFIVPIFWTVNGGWQISSGGTFVPYDNTIRRLSMDEYIADEKILPASKAAAEKLRKNGQVKEVSSHIFAEPFMLLPEACEAMRNKIGEDNVFQQIILDCHDEVSMATQACAILNCENIGTTKIEAVDKLNKKRIKAEREPFYSYRVLQITEKTKNSSSSGQSGSHNSPRMHLRRGHIRRLPDRVVWVRATMINASSEEGRVDKDYNIKPRGNK